MIVWGKKYHPYMPLIPTNLQFTQHFDLLKHEGNNICFKMRSTCNDDICRCSKIQGGQCMSLNQA